MCEKSQFRSVRFLTESILFCPFHSIDVSFFGPFVSSTNYGYFLLFGNCVTSLLQEEIAAKLFEEFGDG